MAMQDGTFWVLTSSIKIPPFIKSVHYTPRNEVFSPRNDSFYYRNPYIHLSWFLQILLNRKNNFCLYLKTFFFNNVFSRYGLPRIAYLFTVSGEDFHGNCNIGFCAKHSIWCLWCDSFCHWMYFIKVPGVNWTAVYFTVFLTSLNTSSFYYFMFLQSLCGINKPVTSMQNVKRA